MISLSWVISITIDFFDKDFNASQNSNLEKCPNHLLAHLIQLSL